MKKTLLLSIILLNSMLTQAQFQAGIYYDFAKPDGLMGANINRSHGFSLEGLYQIPKTRLSVGLNLGVSMYGYEEKRDNYMMDNGESFPVEVQIENCYAITNAVLRYDFLPETKLINPYVTFSAGLSYFWTDLIIEDPNARHSFDDCPSPIDSDVLLSDITYNTTFGLGTQIEMSRIFPNLRENALFLDLQASYMLGGEVTYMSLDAPEITTTAQTRNRGEDINVTYVNQDNPEIVHDYHVGDAFTTNLQMVRFRFGFIYKW